MEELNCIKTFLTYPKWYLTVLFAEVLSYPSLRILPLLQHHEGEEYFVSGAKNIEKLHFNLHILLSAVFSFCKFGTFLQLV